MSGGSPLSSAAGIRVRWSWFVSMASILMVTDGCRAWKSSATFCQYVLNGPSWDALCHQVRVTGFLYRESSEGPCSPLLLQAAARRVIDVANSATTARMRRG